ncbi:hypothetical protein S40288_04391 [Stachybotrys chartarum IBT 40288]|nr:hypothetical protein S40288_04391 [Stachybotrys chartarum IBT 40288]
MRNGLRLVYGQRLERENPSTLRLAQLPFSKVSFLAICEHLSIHRSIVRVLLRSTVEVFEYQATTSKGGEKRTVYYCRTSGACEGDLCLSATYFPERFFTDAVLYGCTDGTVRSVQERLVGSESKTFHPMLLPTIVAELERERQIGHVRKATEHLSDRIDEMMESQTPAVVKEGSLEVPSGSDGSITDKDEDSTTLWLELSMFRNGMENWRDQLVKMIEHVDELSRTWLETSENQRPATRETNPRNLQPAEDKDKEEGIDDQAALKSDLHDTGVRIKARLQQLKSDYDFHIRDCTTLIDAMSLATQLASSCMPSSPYPQKEEC